MAGRRRNDEFERREENDRSEGWLSDVGPDDVWLTRVGGGSMRLGRHGDGDRQARGWRHARHRQPVVESQRTELPADGPADHARLASDVERPALLRSATGEFARIGRRGILRPELLVLVAGAVFILAALVKPWPNPQSAVLAARETATAASSTVATAARSPLPGASSSVDVYALIPPYNYRPGQWPPPGLQSAAPGSAWESVDWSFLNVLDDHPSWGVAAINLPTQPPTGTAATPDVSWVQEVAPWQPSQILVPRGSSTYALAITWPAGIRVDSISFDYLSYDSPKVGVTPVPAAAVATPPPAVDDATATPTPGAAATPKPGGAKPVPTKPILRTLPPNSGTMISGAFWIPPSSDLSTPAPQSVRTAWQEAPWVWPLGSYRVTLATNAGQMIVALRLQTVG